MTKRNATNYSADVLERNPELCAAIADSAAPNGDKRSPYEIELQQQLELGDLMLGDSCIEFEFDDSRNWRFDFAWPSQRIACEVDGGNHMVRRSKKTGRYVAVGRHTQSDDYRKRNAATAAGWRVFAFTPEMIRSGDAFATMQDALEPVPFA